VHGANRGSNPGCPPEKARGNKNAMTYGAYINRLLNDEERELFELFYNRLHQDFKLNESSDEMSAQMACIYFVRLVRAIEGGNAETMNKVDLLLSRKLSELKATKDKREGDSNLQTTPAEWAASLLEEYRKLTAKAGEKKKA
jgi:hypothetical protein